MFDLTSDPPLVKSFHNSIEMKIERRKRIKLGKYIWEKNLTSR